MNTTDAHGSVGLAASITRAASRQTYYTIRLLADREGVGGAYRAYAYFRWVDDTLDAGEKSRLERQEFIERQKRLLEECYKRREPCDPVPEEQILVDLVSSDPDPKSGLHTYLYHMMAVMAFDAERRGRLISQWELNDYTHSLASAVTEAMHYFIGQNCASPHDESRYLAVSAAHITHMLRDTLDDIECGYCNVPHEILQTSRFSPFYVSSAAYRAWVRGRVELAREYFRSGKNYLRRVQSPRCRLAGLAYMARFEGVLDAIEKDDYVLRRSYPEGASLRAVLRAWRATFPRLVEHPKLPAPEQRHPLREL